MESKAKYTAEQIADWFLLKTDTDAGDILTNLKLQKLLYYAQAWYLVFFKKPLFDDEFQAWTHGAVIPSIYQKFKEFTYKPIKTSIDVVDIDIETENLLNDIMNIYGEKTAKFLENLNHSESPWIDARSSLAIESRCTNIITKEVMKDFYTKLYENAKE